MRFVFLILCLTLSNLYAVTVSQHLQKINNVILPNEKSAGICTELLKDQLSHVSVSVKNDAKFSGKNTLFIGSTDMERDQIPENTPAEQSWIFVQLTGAGANKILTSDSNLLYTALYRLLNDWSDYDVAVFKEGRFFYPTFEWTEANDGFFAARKYFSYHYDPDQCVKEFARMGCTHVPVNALATPFPYEQGPPGEHYYRFYITNPDLDQFVATDLNDGVYPHEYLAANCNQMRKNITLARKYGLKPGLAMCSPRSVPEAFFDKYPLLRGARIDHPFHSYEPRYTMTLAHPVVRWHYAQMMEKMIKMFPDLDYAYIWSNDSGSGFEHTMTTYPGRNGGAFLVREWRTNEQIADKAAGNIFQYLTILKNAGQKINKDFGVILRIFSFTAAQDTLLKQFKDGYDMRVLPSSVTDKEKWQKLQTVQKKGSLISTTVNLGIPYSHVAGIAFPWECRKRLDGLADAGVKRISLTVNPQSLAPYDINREIFHTYQFEPDIPVDSVVTRTAKKWIGEKYSSLLVNVWQLTDKTVADFPNVPLYQGYGFVSFRLWVRPLVPNFENIPKQKRAYYEDFSLSNYNNPNLVDLSENALWTLVPVDKAQQIVDECEKQGYKPLNQAIQMLDKEINKLNADDEQRKILIDQRDRICALICYYRTLQNTARWIVDVHGYIDSKNDEQRKKHRKALDKMMADEIENMQNLLDLWNSSSVTFTPISSFGENWYTYGDNLGELLAKKIELMKEYQNDEPYIDGNFMWKMPEPFSVTPDQYLKFVE